MKHAPRIVASLFVVFLLAAGMRIDATTYLRATYDGAAANTGSGPLATAGGWDPAGVEIGTGGVPNENPAFCSAFIDASAGLDGSTQGLHVVDLNDTGQPTASVLAYVEPDAGLSGPTATSVWWVDYRFRLDPAASDRGEPLVELFIYDDYSTNRILRSWLGWYDLSPTDSTPMFRYALFTPAGGSEKAILDPVTAGDEWRILIKIDPVGQKQTHWIWKNGDTQHHAILGVEHDLLANQTLPLERIQFQSHREAEVDFVLDQFEVSDAGPPAAPSGLKAIAVGPTSVDLTWVDNSNDETNFTLQRSTSATGPWTDIGLPSGTTTHGDSGLTSGTRYHYRVAAENAAGLSAWAETTSAITVYTGTPLSDWILVTDYGADGQDALDDTQALQAALDALVGWWGSSEPHVLYFPNGTYRVSETLFMEGHVGVQFVGESTDGVVIQWHGSPGSLDGGSGLVTSQPMFHAEGNKHATYRNLTWDGNNIDYVVAFDQSYCGNGPNYNSMCTGMGNSWFTLSETVGVNDTASGHFDSVFKNAWVGLRLGHYNVQNDELSVRRCRFIDNTVGVSVEDFNALQEQFWDSEFRNNQVGITNYIRDFGGAPNNWAGDFRVLRGRFSDNEYDIYMSPTGHFTFRDCWSKGSGRFLHGQGQSATACMTSLIGNQIDEFDQDDTFLGRAISIANSGTLVMLDNAIDTSSPGGPRDKPVQASTWNYTDLFAGHNQYTTADPYEGPNIKLRNIDDQQVVPFDLTLPPLPTAVDLVGTRPVYTMTDVDHLQEVIDAAEADPLPAVVHIPSGRYYLSQTLHISAGSDLIITGNGSTTELRWDGTTDGPMIEIDGHQVDGFVLRDLLLNAKSLSGVRARAIHVKDLNQENSRALLHRVLVTQTAESTDLISVHVDGCDRVKFDAVDLTLSGNVDNIGLQVEAGPQPQEAKVVWTGTVLGNDWDFDVVNNVNGVKFLVSSTYMEKSSHYLRARGAGGNGEVTVHGGKAATRDSAQTNTYSIEDFSGNFSLINNRFFDIDPANEGARLEQTGSADVDIQLIGGTAYWEPEFSVTPSAYVIRASQKYSCINDTQDPLYDPMDPPYPACGGVNAFVSMPDIGTSMSDEALLDTGLNLLRNLQMPNLYDEPGASETYQINFDNVHVWDPLEGLHLEGGIPGTPTSLSASAAGSDQIDLTWTDVAANEDGFDLERSLSTTGGFTTVATLGPDATATTDPGLVDGTRYHYRVSSFRNRTGASGLSNTDSAVTVILPPSGLIATPAGTGAISLGWVDASASEDGFEIERSLMPVGGFAQIAGLGPDQTAFLDSGLDPGTTYYYRVRDFNAEAGASAYSSTAIAATDPPAPGPAEQMTVGRSGVSLEVGFAPAPCATDHTIYWGETEGLLGGSPVWVGQSCGLGGGGSHTFDPGTPLSGEWIYFVVVGNNGTLEGSYGQGFSNSERPEAIGMPTCDYPQQLADACE